VKGELTESFSGRRMEKVAGNSKGHYIVCGLGSVGFYITSELYATKRPHVIVDTDRKNREKSLRVEELYVPGSFVGKHILVLNLKGYTRALLLAIKPREDWVYDLSENYVTSPESTSVYMATPEGRSEPDSLKINK
jgi:voltage-gated potassium channel